MKAQTGNTGVELPRMLRILAPEPKYLRGLGRSGWSFNRLLQQA